jgi:hypothetical protein
VLREKSDQLVQLARQVRLVQRVQLVLLDRLVLKESKALVLQSLAHMQLKKSLLQLNLQEVLVKVI